MSKQIEYSQYELIALASWVQSLNPGEECPRLDAIPAQLNRLAARVGSWQGAGFFSSLSGRLIPVAAELSIQSALGGWVYYIAEDLFIDGQLFESKRTMLTWDGGREQLIAVEFLDSSGQIITRCGEWYKSVLTFHRFGIGPFVVSTSFHFDSESSLVLLKENTIPFSRAGKQVSSRIKFYRN